MAVAPPSREATLVLESAGVVNIPLDLFQTLVDQALVACAVPSGAGGAYFDDNRMVLHLPGDDRLFALPDHILPRLPDNAQVKLVLGDEDDEPTSLVRSNELTNELRDIRGQAVTAFVTTGFVAQATALPPTGFRRTVVETRFADVDGFLRTITAPARVEGTLSLAVAPDGIHAVTGHADGTMQNWDLTTGDRTGDPVAVVRANLRALAFIGDGKIVAAGSGNERALPADSLFPADDVTAVAVRPGSDDYALGDDTGLIVVITARDSATVRMRQPAAVVTLAATQETIFAANEAEIRPWTWDGSVAGPPLSGHGEYVRALAAHGDILVSGAYDRTIIQWDTETGAELRRSDAGVEVQSLAVAPNGRWFVSGHPDGSVQRWDLASGSRIGAPLRGPHGDVYALAVTPDGRMIVSAGTDGTLRRWDADTGTPIVGAHTAREQLPDVISDIESATDALGVAGDVHTIATVLAAASTKPPLSIALLGDWGTGKSSFMAQLRDRMTELTGSTAVVGEQKAYVSNLRQVTFNAWHYSDDHLWVGLIEQIFRELRAKPPASADPSQVRVLEARLADEDAERARLDHELRAVQRMDTPFGKVLAPLQSWPVFRAALRGWWNWRLLAGLLVLAAGVAAFLWGQQVLGVVVAVLGPVVAVWSRAGQYVETAREELRARKAKLDKDIRATTDELDELDPARRLDRLLAEITAEDRYAGFRGLTGRIHHDLRRLSADLAAADPPPLQRIVLYVDDLDRCTPARVVDVLQAVNLLLTMDLFMVVVAVDPRWLLRSLNRHHSGLFDADVGPVVYLDKIFHIPFALRPMGNHAVSYLHSLLPDVDEETAPPPETMTPREVEQFSIPRDRHRRPPVAPQQVPAPTAEPAVPLATAEGLRVTAAERDFLGRLTPLLTTPRAIKKLTNLYRLLRLSVPRDELPAFLDGEYQVAALLLATLAGTPNQSRHLLDRLTTGEDVEEVTKLAARFDVDQPADVYRRWAAEVARFGFTTYDLYGG